MYEMPTKGGMARLKVKKTKEKKQMKSDKKRTGKVYPSTFELIPFKRLENGRVVTEDDQYIRYLQITTRNINGLSEDEQYQVMSKLEVLMRIYEHDFSWLTLNFPPNVESNLSHWRKKVFDARNAKDGARAKTALEQLSKILWVEANLKNLEFYFQIFGISEQDIKSKEDLVKRLCGLVLGGHEISEEKVEKILYKISNMNSVI